MFSFTEAYIFSARQEVAQFWIALNSNVSYQFVSPGKKTSDDFFFLGDTKFDVEDVDGLFLRLDNIFA